ncbi:MAG: M48 family metalloprotease [Halobacteriota archaeon]|nr:M48 family metalloprotease [Halobacteriota archaeon]
MKPLARLQMAWTLITIILVIIGMYLGDILGLEGYIIPLLLITVMIALYGVIYSSSDKIILHRFHSKPIEDKNSEISKTVRELSKALDIPTPKVYTSDLSMPNLLVVGKRAEHASIVMTGPIQELLGKEELRAAFAYGMSHIKNEDTLISTIVAMVCGSITALATIAMWASIFIGFGQEDDPGPMLVKFFVMSIVAPPVALIIQLTSEESRILKADERAAQILSDPQRLSSALKKLQAELMSSNYHVNPSYVHLFIVSPLKDNFSRLIGLDLPTYNLLFRTHPRIEKRVRRLKFAGGERIETD